MSGVAAGRPAPVAWDGLNEDLPGYFDELPDATFVSGSDGPPVRPLDRWPVVASVLPVESLCLNRSTALLRSFPRAVDLPYEASLVALQRWWRERARGDELGLGRSRLHGPPALGRRTCRLEVHLAQRWRPAVAMELELEPWFGTFGTKMTLHPRRMARPSRRYFRAGHAFMDAVTARLFRYAGPR
jgi:hypothetical protein